MSSRVVAQKPPCLPHPPESRDRVRQAEIEIVFRGPDAPRARMLECPPGSGSSGPVPVKGKHHLTHDPEDPFEVFGCCGSPQCRYSVVDTVLMQPHRIHIAFDDKKAL